MNWKVDTLRSEYSEQPGRLRRFCRICPLLISSFLPVLMWACGGGGQFAAGTVYEARAQIAAAKRAGAEEMASAEFQEASRLLSEAEAAMSQKAEEKSYQLSYKSYLKARLAEAIAIQNKSEREAGVEEAGLAASEVELNRSRQERIEAERELEKFSKD